MYLAWQLAMNVGTKMIHVFWPLRQLCQVSPWKQIYNFIGTLQYKLFVFLSEEKESYLHEKKNKQTDKQTNKTNNKKR